MTDIFISYSRNDREKVRRIAEALEAEGFDVWWDPDIPPGESFSAVIDRELKNAKCIIAVWSESSIKSNWVQEEADDGMMRNTLIPVMIDQIDLPRGFKRLQTADLIGWTGDTQNPNWQLILTQVRKLVSERDAVEAAERQAAAREHEPVHEPAPAAQPAPQPTPKPAPQPGPAAQAPAPAQEKRGGVLALPIILGLVAAVVVGGGYYFFAGPGAGGGDADDAVSAAEAALAEVENIPVPETPPAPEEAAAADPATPDATAEMLADASTDEAIEEAPVEEAAAAYQPGETFRDCDECPQLVVVAGGDFKLGAPDGEFGRENSETPQVDVTLASNFAIGAYEVTFDEWEACRADGGCGDHDPADMGWGKGGRPLVNVSFEDAQAYVAWLSQKTGVAYRLPSEAEWEYAARAGSDSPFHTGDNISTRQANFNGQYPYNNAPQGAYRSQTTPVGTFAANAFGLFDMTGNVWEWTQDCWRPTHSGASADGAPVGGACSQRVIKGGAWNAGAWRLRSSHRRPAQAGARDYDTGFRIARDL